AGPVQAAQDRARERWQQAGAGHGAAQGAPRSLSTRVAQHGGDAGEREGGVRTGAHTGEGPLPGSAGELPRTELWRDCRRDRWRDPSQGARPGRRRRLDGAVQHAAADSGRCRRRKYKGAKKMSAFDWQKTVSVHGLAARGASRGAFLWLAAALALAATSAVYAQGANSIDSLTVTKGSSGNTIVKFTLKSPPANPPAGFAIASPPRIALDFLDTGNGLGATQRVLDDPAVRSLNVIQSGNRTRVVFNLNKPQTFSTQVEGNTVLVTLFDQSERLDAKTQVVERFAEARPGDVVHALRDVDFRRGANGEGRVVVDLSDNATGIDIRQQGKNLIVDFIKTNLPRNLERRLDVQDFGTPITAVDTFNQGGNTRMVIEPKGLWEDSAYQTDNRFILEVRAVQEDPNKLVQGAKLGYKGEKLSLNFQNVEVRSVLQVIADFTGLNIITSDTVTGSLTLRLKDIPWDQALDIIMQTKGLDMRKNGNVVLIAPREELALKEKQQLEAQKDISELEPLVSEAFQLNYIKAQDLLNLITTNRQQQFGAGAGQTATTGGQGSFISKRGVAMVDPRANLLFGH